MVWRSSLGRSEDQKTSSSVVPFLRFFLGEVEAPANELLVPWVESSDLFDPQAQTQGPVSALRRSFVGSDPERRAS